MTNEKSPLGQYFTPPHIAEIMVGLLQSGKGEWILEPSSGTGVFIEALRTQRYENVCAVELDGTLVNYEADEMHVESFVSWTPTHKFSAVIGNPPYIRWKNLDKSQQEEIKLSRYWGELFNSLSDYLMVFIVNAVDALRTGGELIFVTPSFWFHTQHAQPVRDFLTSNGYFTDIVTFGEAQVFEKVSSSIVIFRYVKSHDPKPAITLFQFHGTRRVQAPLKLREPKQFTVAEIPQFSVGAHWTLATAQQQAALKRFEDWTTISSGISETLFEAQGPNQLGQFVNIANGMVSGLDRAFRVPEDLRNRLPESEKDALRVVAKGANLTRLVTREVTLYIDVPQGLSEIEFRARYPTIATHLDGFREVLEERFSYGRKLPFWEWAFRRSESFFLDGRQKVFVPCKERITNKSHVRFSLVPLGAVATQDVTALAPLPSTRESVEYISAFLTLDEVSHWIRDKGLIKGGVAEFSERPLASIPFRPIEWSSHCERQCHDEIVEIVRSATVSDPAELVFKQIREIFLNRLGLGPAVRDE